MPAANLRDIHTFPELVRYLEDELDWPLQEYGFDELTFEFTPTELGLKEDDAARIKAIHQLRPLATGQPWGIFFVEFENKKLPVVVLRRILSHLVIKKRESANKASAPAWHAEDLMFITAFGEENSLAREIAFAHFHQNPGDLPILNVLGWDGGDTPLKLAKVADDLRQRLRWPDDESDTQAWRENWRRPFRHRIGHVIQTADLLAEELARLARGIRDKAKRMLAAETERGALTRLYKAFQTALIHDLTPESFADTYAQTITYGLLTAAISRTEMSEGRHGTALIAQNVVDMVPITNPFLKEMLQTFLKAGGRKGGIDFDELGIQDVVELLRGQETDLPAILRDFGSKTRGEDPVIHFYEHFLNAYNKQLKIQRGVFYTPQPVVSYIVRSVHELLQSEFGLADGLADTTTWGEMLKKHPEMKLPPLTDAADEKRSISPDEPFVQILDPATGTATFLVEVIDVIYSTLTAKWKKQELNEIQRLAAWNDYIPKGLLPRLHAYELMMAPYAIAHMKIGLKLAETGYKFATEERARIYLTNALEPWQRQLNLPDFDALAHEATAVNTIKRDKRFTVIIGNPPYSVSSRNNNSWIVRLCEKYKQGLIGERNVQPLSDDYIKFLRFAQFVIEQSASGMIGMITNREYLQGILYRSMRKCLLETFPHITLCDLHGQRGEMLPAGADDENVFEIEKGVAIGIYASTPRAQNIVEYSELIGSFSKKTAMLSLDRPTAIEVKPLAPHPPQFFLKPWLAANSDEYQALPLICDFFDRRPVTGFATHRDSFAIGFSKNEILQRLAVFLDTSISDAEVMSTFALSDTRDWKLNQARRVAQIDPAIESRIVQCAYRPFDTRWVIYSDDILEYPRRDTMQHIGPKSLALVCSRIVKDELYAHIFVSKFPIEKIFISPKSSNNAQVLLTQTNVDDASLLCVSNSLRVPQRFSNAVQTSSEELLNYIYAVLHSPTYRYRYSEFLKTDFPRLPFTSNIKLFHALAQLGSELLTLHLLESPKVNDFITLFEGDGDNGIPKKPTYQDGAIWINASQRFSGVPEAVWNFHVGGYQVCEKWLKDRKGRTLSVDDIAHYQRVVVALNETIRLMAEIDVAIEAHGGWPGAFQSAADSGVAA